MGEPRTSLGHRQTLPMQMVEARLVPDAPQSQQDSSSLQRGKLAREETRASVDLFGAGAIVGRYTPHRTGNEYPPEQHAIVACGRARLRGEPSPMQRTVEEHT